MNQHSAQLLLKQLLGDEGQALKATRCLDCVATKTWCQVMQAQGLKRIMQIGHVFSSLCLSRLMFDLSSIKLLQVNMPQHL